MEEVITERCLQLNLSPRDEEYRCVAWLAFQEAYRKLDPVRDPDFWSKTFEQMESALQCEKKDRNLYLYGILSLNVPVQPESNERLLDLLPSRSGDFTNYTSLLDFLNRLPRESCQPAHHLMNRDSLEEARSFLGWTDGQLCSAVEQLRSATTIYEML